MSDTLVAARFRALGTTAMVLVTDEARLESARVAVEGVVAEIDATCSRFRPDSELARLPSGRAVSVSPLLLDAVLAARRAAELTDGVVDFTVATALRAWGYDRDFGSLPPDGPPLSLRLVAVPGWRTVTIDEDLATVSVPPGVEIDLGATAKALAADRAAAAAFTATGCGVLVALGGDLAVAGQPPTGGWDVRVADDHAADPGAPGQTVSIASGGLATSGTTVRCWIRGGVRVHHLIDPRTGRPSDTCWRTVTVAAGSCLDANIASTAAIVLGQDAPQWLAERALPARLVRSDGSVRVVAGFPKDRAV